MDEHRSSARRRLRATAVLVLPVSLLLGACGGSTDKSSDPVVTVSAQPVTPEASARDYPSNALLLRDTIPLSYKHRTLTVYTFGATTAHLDVVGTDGNTQLVIVKKAKTFTAGGIAFTVIDLIPGNAADGSSGQLVLLPKDS